MKMSKVDIAEAFGMYYDGSIYEKDDTELHIFKFKDNDKEIKISWWIELDEAWELAATEFVKPLEKLLF